MTTSVCSGLVVPILAGAWERGTDLAAKCLCAMFPGPWCAHLYNESVLVSHGVVCVSVCVCATDLRAADVGGRIPLLPLVPGWEPQIQVFLSPPCGFAPARL